MCPFGRRLFALRDELLDSSSAAVVLAMLVVVVLAEEVEVLWARKLVENKVSTKSRKEEGRNKGTVISIRMVPLDARGAVQTGGQDKAQ